MCRQPSTRFWYRLLQVLAWSNCQKWGWIGKLIPTVAGLILIGCSICAVSGGSFSLCCNTSASQRVLTKVVRPVPDAPVHKGERRGSRQRPDLPRPQLHAPTTIMVNWTPLTLFLLLPEIGILFSTSHGCWSVVTVVVVKGRKRRNEELCWLLKVRWKGYRRVWGAWCLDPKQRK